MTVEMSLTVAGPPVEGGLPDCAVRVCAVSRAGGEADE